MEKVISFNKNGYEPFFDFVKAFAIVGVLMGHTLPCLDETGYNLWYGMQVPLFVLLQVFHVFKRERCKFSMCKTFHRVLLPYLLIQVLPFVYLLHRGMSLTELVHSYIYGGE